MVDLQLVGRLSSDLRRIERGFIHASLLPAQMARIEIPYCADFGQLCPRHEVRYSLLELVGTILAPDIDRDGDGREHFATDRVGKLIACYDGDGSVIPPLVANDPATCADSPRIADAYSISLEFTAVRAAILGIVPDP